MRRTAKYVQACHTARTFGLVTDDIPHEELYGLLEVAGYSWSAKREQWVYRPPTVSVDTGQGGNIFRARLMAHPNQIDSFVADAVRQFQDIGYAVDEVSGHYPNRRGVGTRVYLTMTKGAP